MNTKIQVEGMGCENCSRHVTAALEGLPGVKDVMVNLQTGEVTFDNPELASLDAIKSAIEDAGYQMK